MDPEARSASHSDSSANPLDRLARGVFVGRERELERLRAAFDEAFAGRGSVVMLVGEPGIGKTRTSLELETYARMRGAKVLWGRANESSGAPPYFPWTQLGRAYAAATDDATLTNQLRDYAVELQRLFPGVRNRFPGLPEPPPVEDESAQFRLFDAMSGFYRDVAVQTPLVLVLDDLHWADRPTLALLTHLARELTRARILVVGTYRDTDLDRQHPLSRTLAELNREQLFTRINLRGLTRDEVGEYIRATAQVEPTARLIDRVHEETEGNAFFLAEVVNLMAQEGSFEKTSVSDVAIPEGVKEALGRRLDRLSPEANELLSLAAVLGREFDHAQLVAVSGKADDEVLRLVEEALAARVLEETGAVGGYRFTHALMQETLLGELSAARRVRLHGQIAEALDALYSAPTREQLPELAAHYRESAALNSADAARAITLTLLSAVQASDQLAWDDAARLFEAVLQLAADRGAPDLDVADVHRRMTDCYMAMGQAASAVEHFWRCHRLLVERGDRIAVAELAARFGARERLGVALLAEGAAACAEALASLSEAERRNRPDLVAALRLGLLANWAIDAGHDFDSELDAIETLAETHGLWAESAGVMFLRAGRDFQRGNLAGAEEWYRRTADLYERHGRSELSSLSRMLQGACAWSTSGLDEADAILGAAEAHSDAPRWMPHIRSARVAVLILRGQVDGAAQSLLQQAHAPEGNARAAQVSLFAYVAELRGGRQEIETVLEMIAECRRSTGREPGSADTRDARLGPTSPLAPRRCRSGRGRP